MIRGPRMQRAIIHLHRNRNHNFRINIISKVHISKFSKSTYLYYNVSISVCMSSPFFSLSQSGFLYVCLCVCPPVHPVVCQPVWHELEATKGRLFASVNNGLQVQKSRTKQRFPVHNILFVQSVDYTENWEKIIELTAKLENQSDVINSVDSWLTKFMVRK